MTTYASRVTLKPKAQPKQRFGPVDHGQPVTARQAEVAEYVSGFKYEIIDGRLYVSPHLNVSENRLEHWIRRAIERYSDSHPDVIN